MTYADEQYDDGWTAGYNAAARQTKTALARVRAEHLTAVTKLAEENAALAARIGELATKSPTPLINYPIRKLGKNLKPAQQALPQIGDKVILTRPDGSSRFVAVASIRKTPRGNDAIKSRFTGLWYSLDSWDWRRNE